MINGGSHAGNKLAMQEFMILPVGASSFKEAMRIGAEVYHNLKNVIKQKYGQDATNVGDEGGFAPNILENQEGIGKNNQTGWDCTTETNYNLQIVFWMFIIALELLKNAISKAGYTDEIVIGMDVAASEFYRDGKYDLDFKSPDDPSRYISPDELADLYKSFIQDYPGIQVICSLALITLLNFFLWAQTLRCESIFITTPVVSIEDPFDQDDWEAWSNFTNSTDIQVVGDDLTVTNPKRIANAVENKACNCLLLKVNQIGSVTESLQAWV